jgi:hypothetical protein
VSEPISAKDFIVDGFTKAEKYSITDKGDPAARLISPRSARAGVEFGRFTKPIEGVIYKAINRVAGAITVAKGLNASEVGKLIHKAA